MENLKVKSDLIDGTGINEDVFAALNTPDSHIFSLQRFADVSVSLRQDPITSGDAWTTTMISTDTKFGNFVAGYTLGRSSSTDYAAATVFSAEPALTNSDLVIAPLANAGTEIKLVDSYKLVAYAVNSTETRIAIQYDGLPAHSSTASTNVFDYLIGFAGTSNITLAGSGHPTWNQSSANSYSTVAKTGATYSSTYLPLSTYQGLTTNYLSGTNTYLASSGTMKYSFDAFDVKLSAASGTVGTALTGVYVFKAPKGTVGEEMYFVGSDVGITFDGVDENETETYLLNGISTTVIGKIAGTTSATNKFSITTNPYQKNSIPTFSGILDKDFNSNVSIAFSLNDVASSISLDGLTYKSDNGSGTVTFSVASGTNYIRLGLGNFTLDNVSGTNVFMTDNASATFNVNANTFLLGKDYAAEMDDVVLSFTGTAGATVIDNGSSNLTLAGTYTLISGTGLTGVSFNLSDTAKAQIGNYTFQDATNNSETFVHFTSPSDITIGGVFSGIYSGTDKALTNVAFTLNDSAAAKLGTFYFSDTQNGEASFVKFGKESNTIILGGPIEASGTFNDVTFTLSSTGTYTLNSKPYTVNALGIGSDNTLAFIDGPIDFTNTFAAWAKTAIGESQEVTGYTAGKNINFNTSTAIDIAAGNAQILQGYYFGGNGTDASGTVKFSNTSKLFALTGNLNVSAASGTKLIGLDGETFTATAGSFYIADSGTVKVNGLTFVDASDGYVSNAVFGSVSDVTLKGAFANVYSGTEKTTPILNFGFTLGDSATAVFGSTFSFSDTADGNDSFVKFGAQSNTFTLSGDMVASGTFTNATFTLSDVAVYKINGKNYNVTKAGIGDANELQFISTNLTLADTFAGASTNTLIVEGVTGVSVGANVGLATGTTTIKAGEGLLINDYYFGAQKGTDSASGTVYFSGNNGFFALTGNLNVAKASGTELIGLNTQSFTATQGSFYIADTGSILVNSFTFKDASDSFVSKLTFDGAGSALTLAGSMGVTGKFVNGATAILSNVGSYTLNADAFIASKAGIGETNKVTLISTTLDTSDTHKVFDIDKLEVTGFSVGSNITIGDTTIESDKAKLLGGYYFAGDGTVEFSTASEINLTGTLTVDKVGTGANSSTLVGVASTNFTTGNGAYTFFLADGGEGTKINDLSFNEVADGSVTKLAYATANSSMGVFGSVILASGSDTNMVFTLNSTTGLADGSLAFANVADASSMTFMGNGATVQQSTTNLYSLTTGANDMTILGSSTSLTYSVANTTGASGTFKFGGITIGGSSTGISSAIDVVANGNLTSSTSLDAITIGNGLVQITDNPQSATYRIDLVGNSMSGATISDIDVGAKLYSVASATQVVTNGIDATGGLFTFSGTSILVAGTGTQIFSILNDADGVTFNLDGSGTVISITDIDAGATVAVTDTTFGSNRGGEAKTFTADGSWFRNATNGWDIKAYLGYIVSLNSGTGTAFTVSGIESTTDKAHVAMKSYSQVGQSGTNLFTIYNSAIESGTQVIFQNAGTGKYSAQLSGTAVSTLFSDLLTTGASYGVLATSDTTNGISLSLASVGAAGTATALSELPTNLASELSLTLSDYALNVYDGYNVSGTGVGVAVSNTVTVDANGKTAIVGMPENATIAFGTNSGTYLINGLSTHTFTVDATAGGAVAGTNSAVFALSLTNGAAVTDTFAANTASALTINDLTYSASAANFSFKAGDTNALNITSGILATTGEIGSYTTTDFAFTKDAGLVLGNFTHTATADATFKLSETSGTQKATVTNGILNEQVASGTSFFFNGELYTATSQFVAFDANATTNTLTLESSKAIGNMAGTGTYLISVLSNTYVMDAGSTAEISYKDGEKYNVLSTYTSGTGTLSATNTQTFAVSDFYLTGGQSGTATDSPFIYTASGTAILGLALNGDTQTITFTSGGGTRSDTATTFTFNDNPYTTTSEGLTYYIGEGSATSAAGVVYKGAGTREFSLASDSALLTGADALTYHSNTYTFAGGLINIDIDKASGTFTAGAGSATWFASADNPKFYFDYNKNNVIDANELYTAKTQDSNTALYALVDSASKVTGLYNAIGAGTREGSGTYVVGVLDNASYTMAENATVLLTFSGTATAPSILANESYTSGTGILNVAVGSSFAIAQAFIDGTSNTSTIADADIFRYTASTTSVLSLSLDGTNTTISFSGFATRSDTKAMDTAFDFGGNTYTSTQANATFYISDSMIAKGEIYSGVGTRPFTAGSDTFNVTHLDDTYSVTGGTYTLSLTNGASDLAVTAGTASATFGVYATFHFSSTYGSFAYVSTTDTKLGITFTNGTNTTLVDAIGAGTRTLDTQTTFAISALNDATYTFGKDSTALLTIDKIDSYSETAYAGTGYMTATSTFTAAFDANGAYTSGTSYAYTASGSAVLSVGLVAGELTSQTIVEGAAIRSGNASDTSFVYALNGGTEHTYTNTDVAGSSFILNSDTAKTYGAAGLIYTGAGTRDADAKDSFTSIYGNEYKDLVGSATYKLTLTKGDGTEGIWSVSTTQTFDNTFFFKGTQYTSDENSKVTLALVFNNGATDTQEVGLSGAGSFNTTDSGKTFAYDGNTYYVDSSVGAVLSVTFDGGDASQVATFVKGKGNIDNPSGGNYVFIEDSNTYTMGAYVASISKDNETSTVVHSLTSGSGTLNTSASNGMFNYAYNGVMHQYSDTGKAVITLVGDPDGASATFTGGSGQRIDSTTNLAFNFDGNNYTSTGKAITFTLELSDTTVPASLYEHATSGSGTRTVNGSFTYESPISKQNENYTGNATLDLVIVDGEGTETFMGGTATRVIDAGTTFAVAPDKFAFANASDTMTFTATQQGTYTLTAKDTNSNSANGEMLFMGYNVDVVTESFTDGVGTGTAVSPFNYTSKVTSQTETYTGDGVVFGVTVAGGANTATWVSGSATMTLDANRTFVFDSPTDSQSYTYTVETTAGFTRTGEDVEFISSGEAFRTTTAKVDAFTILDSVSNTYTADAGAQIKLTASGTTGAEAFNAGSATFTAATGGTFNYDAANADSHTYNVTADVTMQALVKDGAFGSVFSAVGAGTRNFDASETTIHTVLGDAYTVDSGTFTLTLSTGNNTESETLTAGSGIFSTTSTFHVNDFYLGNSTATSTGIEYTAVGSSGVTLALTVANGSETIAITSGIGTRDVNTDTFLYNNYTYSVSGTSIAYAISAESQTSAAGYLYNAVATRDGADSNTTFVFNEDKYTAENGTMRLTVTEGKATEDMFAGTATYKAETGDVFHFNYNNKGLAAYTATAVSNLTATFENGDTSSAKFASITATGTRLATTGDTGYTLEYMSDTYSAVAGSSTILFTAGGAANTATETIKEDAGIVQLAVDTASNNKFHNNTTGNWYEYTAQSGTTISLALDNDSVQSFSNNPFALRTDSVDSGTVTFKFTAGNNGTEQEYTATEVGYLLTGTGTALSEAVNSAEGAYRTNGAGESYTTTTMWNNVYTLTSGTYTMNVANGVGTETLTAGAGTATYEKGKSFNYNSSNTSFIANVEGATLGLTVNDSNITERLTAGAGYNGTDTYIAVDGAKVTLEGATTDATLTLTATDSSTLIGLTATAFDASTYTSGLTSAENLASFTADVAANGDVAIKGKLYSAVAAGTLTGSSALDSFSATSVFTAVGNFTDSNNPTLAGKQIGITGDTELSVAFSTADGIATIDHLTNGITVNDAAGATKAITDSTGTFIFNSTLEGSVDHTQTFNISGGDNSVTFQLDENGLVTGIAGIDAESGEVTITIVDTDTTETETVTVSTVGKVVTRNAETGKWTDTDVEAVSYIVDLESENSLTVYAVDASSDTTKIDYSKIGSVTSDTAGNYTVNVNSGVISDTKAIIVNNTSDKNINFTGAVTVGAVGSMASGAAIQFDTDTTANGAFKTGSISNNKFTDSTNPYTVTGGIFNVGADGVITVNADNKAFITANEGSTNVNLLADTDAGTFAINDGPVVTLKVADSDGKGIYNATLTGSSVTGLKSTNGNNDGVATGTVIIPTAAEGTTFNIEDASVSVTSDTGSMTFEIKDDKLAGISDVSTDAVLNVSGTSDELSINGDTDNKVTPASDTPIKFNKTQKAWVSGDAEAIAANGYVVSVTSGGELQLWYTTSDTTVPAQTTNKADYAKVFGNYALTADDAELPTYGDAISLNTLNTDVKVSVSAGNAGVAVNTAEDKDLALVTPTGNYTINSQEVIPSSEVTVTALVDTGATGAKATVSSAVTIGHDGMNISGATTTKVQATFGSTAIDLTNSAKVTNTNNTTTFNVQGNVTFDGIGVMTGHESKVVTGVNATVAPSGLTIDGNDLNVTGGDLAYTVDVSNDTDTIIIGINGDATVGGMLASDAQILTASTGVFKVASSNEFTISGDESVTLTTSNDSVDGILGLNGTATGNFSQAVTVNTGSVLIMGDDTVAVTGNDTLVTAIDGVGADNLDETAVIANAGGASVVNADKNGNFQFGSSDINRQRYTVDDGDSVVSFYTSSLADYTPKVTAVSGLNTGTIAIAQEEKGLVIDGNAITLGGVLNEVTVTAADSSIVAVNGLEGSVNGLASGVLAQAVDSDVTINGAAMVINEGENGTTLVATASEGGFNAVAGLNAGATVYTAKSADIMTEGEGAFTFDKNNATYTISGDSEVDFITDSQSRVSDITNFNGNLQMTATSTKVNGSTVSIARESTDAAVSDVTIAGTGSGVGAISGLGSGDSVTAPAGAQVAMPGSSDSDTASALTVNGKKFSLYGDSDTVTITPGATGSPDSINGLDPGAKLVFNNTAGTYNVNGEVLTVGVGATVVGDAEGTAHVYDPKDVDIDGDKDSVDDIVKKVTGSTAADDDRYVENLSSDDGNKLAAEIASGNTSNANGNIQMQLTNTTNDSVQTADFSQTTGIKKVSLEGGAQDVKFNDAGGNIAYIGDDATGAKNVELGNGGDIVAIGSTDAEVNVKAGKGQDQIVSKAANTKADLSAGGPTKLMATGYGAHIETTGYDHNTGAGIQTTNNNIKQAIKTNTIQLNNGLVTTNGATTRTNADTAEGTSVVNLYNLKGLMTKVGYTHNDGGELDMSSEHSDVVLKGNYTDYGAQTKGGSSKLLGGLGNDYILAGANDEIDAGAGDNSIELDSAPRNANAAGATINQTATTGRTEVTGFNNEFGTTGDKLNISGSAKVSFAGGVLRFLLGAAELVVRGISSRSGSSADLAESADEDDTATTVSGSTSYAPININGVNTAIIAENQWIGGSEALWSADSIPTAYVGSGSGAGIDLRNMDANVDMVLSGANDANSTGVFGTTNVDFRGINKVRLGNGSSTVRGTADVNNTIVAGLGASSVWGGGVSDDTFIGRQTSLKSGADTFFYVNGDGADVISNFEFRTAENGSTADKINVLDAVVTGASVSGQDVLVNLTGDHDRLTIKNAVGQDFQVEYGNVGSFETLTAQVNYDSLNFDGRAGYYQAINKNAALVASSELDSAEIWLNNNRDFSKNTFVGDFKVLNASNVVGRSTLVGNSNDNTIIGSSENSSMWGGDKGGNDTLVGGAGTDMFWYGKNNGSDTITQVDENDVVNLYDVNIADVENYDDWVITNNSVSFNLKESAGGGSLTIQSNNVGFGIKFADDANTYAINQRDRSYHTK